MLIMLSRNYKLSIDLLLLFTFIVLLCVAILRWGEPFVEKILRRSLIKSLKRKIHNLGLCPEHGIPYASKLEKESWGCSQCMRTRFANEREYRKKKRQDDILEALSLYEELKNYGDTVH